MTSASDHSDKRQTGTGLVQAICQSPQDLRSLAEAIARVIEPGDVLFLRGELGVGKTTLTQMLACSLGVGEEQYVSSPSFALLHEYIGNIPIFHMDLYRLRDEEDVEAAGLLDVLDQRGVCIIEWPDRLGSLTPDLYLDISIEYALDTSRRLILAPHGPLWTARMARVAEYLEHLEQ